MASEVMMDQFAVDASPPHETETGGKKTWDELRRSINETMKSLVQVGSNSPTNFTFRNIPPSHTSTSPTSSTSTTDYDGSTAENAQHQKQRVRLYFLGSLEKSRDNMLLYVDVDVAKPGRREPEREADEAEEEEGEGGERNVAPLAWQPLLDTVKPTWLSGTMSREEQLMLERKRQGTYGITSYDCSPGRGRFVFLVNSALYYCDDRDVAAPQTDARSLWPMSPTLIETACTGARLDPKLCPTCVDLVAFVHSNDIWITWLPTCQEMQLTRAASLLDDFKGGFSLDYSPLTAGIPSFVMSEEFDRYTGYWWQPVADGSCEDGTQTLRILYEEVDEQDVDILSVFAPTTRDAGSVDEYRYPRAGTNNATSMLKIVEFQVDSSGLVVGSVQERHLVEPLTAHCPWAEYLVRAGWTPDGKFVYATLLNRSQLKLRLLLIPLECFVPANDKNDDMLSLDSSSFPPIQCIYEEHSDVWINVHDMLHFFPQTMENEISFLWASQKTGFRHLYHMTSRLSAASAGEDMEGVLDDESRVIRERQLTSVDWDILGRQVWVDESRAVVYFVGLRDTPMETHLYAVSYAFTSDIVRLTEAGYSHTVSMNSECTMFVTTYSSLTAAPVTKVCQVQHHLQGQLSAPLTALLQRMPLSPNYPSPELFSFDGSSGFHHFGLLFRPANCRPGQRYPTVLFVYGGPQVQLASNTYKGLRFLRLHTLAAHGYAVVLVDGRGSCNRGLRFEGAIKDKLGMVEIEDQVEGLYYAANTFDIIDLSRVAIHGWSYGGYLSLMGLVQRPDVFKLAIAGAPVVTWQLYDTGYTERYLSMPEDNAAGYTNGSVLNYVKQFPDQENRLLIVHGLIDENVHFHHTTKLVTALVKNCKPHRLQVYPNERHGIRNHESNEHYKTLLLSFLQDNL